MERTIVSIDVGSTKVCTLVARVEEIHTVDGEAQEKLRIIGVGIEPARGLRRGVVTDVRAATESIGNAIAKAEHVSGVPITEAYVSVGGAHIASENNRGVAAIGKGDRAVDRDDIDRAMESAQTLFVSHNRRIIHSLPREFMVDGQGNIRNPVGLMGFRLEVETHIVTGAAGQVKNLRECVRANKVEVLGLVLQPIASAQAVLRPEEREMGVALVDVGGGTVDIAVYVNDSVWDTKVLGIGGWHVTNDIAIGLKTALPVAEECKVRYACANPEKVSESELIEMATFGGEHLRQVSRRELCEIAAARVEEIIEMIGRYLTQSGNDSLIPAGVVLTGGTAALRDIQQVARGRLGIPVRVGQPLDVVASDVPGVGKVHGLVEAVGGPAYSASVGLLLWGLGQERTNRELSFQAHGGSLCGRIKRWLKALLP